MIEKLNWFFWADWHWIVTALACALIVGFKLITCIPSTIKSIRNCKGGVKGVKEIKKTNNSLNSR